ncbi:MAG: OmpA family protein [Bacteroidales bacterium]|nr:OmpA family protein [Bacteroidales bacterium]
MKGNSHVSSVVVTAVVLVALALSSGVAAGQTYHTSSKKAVRLYKKATNKIQKKDYENALRFVDRSIDCDGKFIEALQRKANIGIAVGDDDMAVEYFEKSLAADSMVFPLNAIKLSDLYDKKGEYSEAVRVLTWYCSLKNVKDDQMRVARRLLENAVFRESAVKNPVDFQPVNLGENVNTDGDEYVNQILPDGSKLYFTRRSTEKDADGFRIEDVYYSTIIDNQCLPSVAMNLNWNNKKRMGAVNISPDQKKMYFVGIDWLDSNGRGDVYVSEYEGGTWGKPQNLGKVVNTPTVESQPCVDADGKRLYFTRYSRVNETTDLYVSDWFDGKWNNPRAINNVNTKGNEMSPFIHPDGKTLYFVSDGLPGMGGYDVFMCKRNDKGEWGQPVNLGYPLNTPDDEISFAVSADGKTGYISSVREGGFGGFDIYSFELGQDNSPEKVEPQRFVLHDIKFRLNSAVLDSSSFSVIDSVASYLLANPMVKVEILGFTDNSGDEQHNAELSLQRANSVKDALASREISGDRMSATGYGENRPLVPNDTEEHKALNRRVEIRYY